MPDAPYSSNTVDAADRLPVDRPTPWLSPYAPVPVTRNRPADELSDELRRLLEELRSFRAAHSSE